MQKLIGITTASLVLAGLTLGMAGCTEESSVERKTEIKGPEGKTTITDKSTVDKSGKNPPAAPGEPKTP